jgi:hypothetical protein
MIATIILEIISLIFLLLAILICLAILILIFLRIHPLISNVPVLLTCNTYISLGLVNVMMLIVYAYNLYGDLHPSVSVNDEWCQLRAYFTFCGCSALYYSCLLQSIFRLFRVIFYRRKMLQSSLFFMIAIIIQWILSCIIPLYNYLAHDYEYMALEYRCWISFTNTLGFSIAILFTYLTPLLATIVIYVYLIRHIRQTNQIQQRRISNERDILVLKRIVMCVLAICALEIPTIIIWFIYLVSHYLIPLSYQIQGLSLVIGLFFITVCFIFITPQIQEIFKGNQRRVLPVMVERINRKSSTK